MESVIYVAGNPLVPEDSLPLRIMGGLGKRFPGIRFIELDPTEDFPEADNMTIIDTVVGIRKVEVLEDMDAVETGRAYSLHDFDLGTNLKLMMKLGRIKSVRIIGVPMGMGEEEAERGVSGIIRLLILPRQANQGQEDNAHQ